MRTAQLSGAAEGLTVTPANMTIEDNDQAPTRIVLSASPAEVTEGGGDTTLTVTANLEGGSARISDTDVSLTVDGLTAEAGADFTAQEGLTLTIPAGRMSHTADLTLTPVDDNLAEGREEVSIGGSNAEPGLPVFGVKVDLTDNDAEPTKITLSLNKDYVRREPRVAVADRYGLVGRKQQADRRYIGQAEGGQRHRYDGRLLGTCRQFSDQSGRT